MSNQPLNMSHASNYSAMLHHMRAAKALGPEEAKKSDATAVTWMKAHKLEDDVLQGAPSVSTGE